MLDLPRKQILGPEELPGQTYDATQQCNLTFGPEYSVCPGMDVCARLWCAVVRQGQMVCLTKKLPAVEGTPCGKGRICLQGKCVDKTKKKYYSVSVFFIIFIFWSTEVSRPNRGSAFRDMRGHSHQRPSFPSQEILSFHNLFKLHLPFTAAPPAAKHRKTCHQQGFLGKSQYFTHKPIFTPQSRASVVHFGSSLLKPSY